MKIKLTRLKDYINMTLFNIWVKGHSLWFTSMLRKSSNAVNLVVITCHMWKVFTFILSPHKKLMNEKIAIVERSNALEDWGRELSWNKKQQRPGSPPSANLGKLQDMLDFVTIKIPGERERCRCCYFCLGFVELEIVPLMLFVTLKWSSYTPH